jgi:CRP-like cAMP-binding protein
MGDRIELPAAEVLLEPGRRLRHIFFPTAGFFAITSSVPGHASFGLGLIGDEGMLGIWSPLGIDVAPFKVEVREPVTAWRFEVQRFRREFDRNLILRRRVTLYAYVMLIQRAQTAVCANFHRVEERLARWLLITRDRSHSDTFHITHEELAEKLGVRRAGITRAAMTLQGRGLIRYSRGNLRILDGKSLEGSACACYALDRKTYTRALD